MDIRNLYKAKSARNGEWCIGSLLQRKDEYYICPLSGIYTVEFSNEEDLYEFGGFVLVDKDTICRCTGLVGKKDGNIIYENDVIKYHLAMHMHKSDMERIKAALIVKNRAYRILCGLAREQELSKRFRILDKYG